MPRDVDNARAELQAMTDEELIAFVDQSLDKEYAVGWDMRAAQLTHELRRRLSDREGS